MAKNGVLCMYDLRVIVAASDCYTQLARYLDMHCSNCSQTLLQCFDDTVITFILPVMKVTQYHQNVAIKFVMKVTQYHRNIAIKFVMKVTQYHQNVAIKFVMKVTQYHRNVAIKFVNNLSSACPNIELGFCVLQTKEQEQGRPGNEATLCAVW